MTNSAVHKIYRELKALRVLNTYLQCLEWLEPPMEYRIHSHLGRFV
jgi:hypothetical protein